MTYIDRDLYPGGRPNWPHVVYRTRAGLWVYWTRNNPLDILQSNCHARFELHRDARRPAMFHLYWNERDATMPMTVYATSFRDNGAVADVWEKRQLPAGDLTAIGSDPGNMDVMWDRLQERSDTAELLTLIGMV